MLVLFRALTYATLFIGLLLVFVPDRILAPAGIVRPTDIGPIQIAAMLVVVAGAALAIALRALIEAVPWNFIFTSWLTSAMMCWLARLIEA